MSNPQSVSVRVDSIDLLQEVPDESIAEYQPSTTGRRNKIAGILEKSKSLVSSFKSGTVYHERLRSEEDPETSRAQHVPLKAIKRHKSATRECLVCLAMVVVLAFVMAGMFGLVFLVALHPQSPTVTIEKVSGGTLFLYTDANNTILVSEFNLTMVSTNPNANTVMEFDNSTLSFGFGERVVGRFATPAFKQSSKAKQMPFLAFINSTTNFTSRAARIRSGFEAQNVTFSVRGSFSVKRKVAKLVPSSDVVYVNCNVSFTPSFPPVILAKSCT